MESHTDIVLGWSDEGKLLFMKTFDINTQRDEMLVCYGQVHEKFKIYGMMSLDRLDNYLSYVAQEVNEG